MCIRRVCLIGPQSFREIMNQCTVSTIFGTPPFQAFQSQWKEESCSVRGARVFQSRRRSIIFFSYISSMSRSGECRMRTVHHSQQLQSKTLNQTVWFSVFSFGSVTILSLPFSHERNLDLSISQHSAENQMSELLQHWAHHEQHALRTCLILL